MTYCNAKLEAQHQLKIAIAMKPFNPQLIPDAIKLAHEYSEDIDALDKILANYEISAQFNKPIPSVRDNQSDSGYESLPCTISICPVNKTRQAYTYTFYCSRNDAVTWEKKYTSFNEQAKKSRAKTKTITGLLCSILCEIGSSIYCEPLFEDWCNDYGSDTDSIKAKETFDKCMRHSAQLKKIGFTEDNQECLPC